MRNTKPYHFLDVNQSDLAIATISNLVLLLEENKPFYAAAFILGETEERRETLENTEQALDILGFLCSRIKRTGELEAARAHPEFSKAEKLIREYPLEVARIISRNAYLSQR